VAQKSDAVDQGAAVKITQIHQFMPATWARAKAKLEMAALAA